MKGTLITLNNPVIVINNEDEYILARLIFIPEGSQKEVNNSFTNLTGMLLVGNEGLSIYDFDKVETKLSIPNTNITGVQYI